MKKQHVLAAAAIAALFSATAARADDSSRPMTREEVVAQVLAARASGELAVTNAGGTWTANQQASKLSRDEVVNQVLTARQSGELTAIEAGGPQQAQAAAAPVNRDDVINQFLATRKAPADMLAIEHSI